MARRNDLTTESIPKLVRALALPAALGFLFNTLYNVVDTFIAGQLSAEALAALSLSFPLFFFIIAISVGLGMGTTALIANALGSNNIERAKHYAAQSLTVATVMGIGVGILGALASPFLFSVLGASDSYLASALLYMQPVFLGMIAFTLSFAGNAILQAQGDTKSYRNALIFGFFLNLILTPTLAFGWFGLPAIGIFGIGIATVATNALGAVYLMYKVARAGLLTRDDRALFIPHLRTLLDLFGQGFPAALSMLTTVVGAFTLTYFVAGFGPEAVAGYGAALRIEQIVLIPGIGINIAVLTLIGQNNGARLPHRVRETIKVGLLYGLLLGTVACAFILLLAEPLMQLFSDDVQVVAYGAQYLSFAAFLSWAYNCIFIVDSSLRGMKKPIFPFVMGGIRQFGLPLPLFFVATGMLALGITSIWWILFLAVWFAAIVSLGYLWLTLRRAYAQVAND